LDIPYVDVSGELRVERDEFGVPRVIGTPAPGPSHGPGSYYYQVGYLWARADAEDQYTSVVYSGISVQGRAAEFIKSFDVQQDIDTRRSTITKAQIEEQLAMGGINQDVVDYLEGTQDAYKDHVGRIESGELPLPAPFVEDVGILEYWWKDRATSVDIFGLTNVIYAVLVGDNQFASGNCSLNQYFNWIQVLFSLFSVPDTSLVNQFADDAYGVNGNAFRFTAKEGDTLGNYCPTGCDAAPKYKQRTAKKSVVKRETSQKRAVMPKISPEDMDKLRNLMDKRDKGLNSASSFLSVGNKLTKCRSTMMNGNPQLEWGIDKNASYAIVNFPYRANFNTPKAAHYSSGIYTNMIRSCTGYTLHISPEVQAVATRDAVFENKENCTLIYDEVTDQENVPGGKAHSLIKVREPDGTVSEFFTDAYQGKDRKSVELGFQGFTRFFPGGDVVVMTRNPCQWDTQVKDFLNGAALQLGLVPFSSLESYQQKSSRDVTLYMGGIDNKKNSYAFRKGLYPTIPQEFDINRRWPGDATDGKSVEASIGRPLPLIADNEYICDGTDLVKNTECGFISIWNGQWSLEDQHFYQGGQYYDRVGSIFYDVDNLIKEKGKLEFEDMRELHIKQTLQRAERVTRSEIQNFGSNAYPVVCREIFLNAIDTQGLSEGLTQDEIDKVKVLLGVEYDGRSVPNVNIVDRVNGLDLDGRWVLSQCWLSILGRNMYRDAIPDPNIRNAIVSELGLVRGDPTLAVPLDTVPRGSWSLTTPEESAVYPAQIVNFYLGLSLVLQVTRATESLGNTLTYGWRGNILVSTGLDLNIDSGRDKYIARALKGALEVLVQGTNTGIGLEDPVTGRANLDLIKPNGVPLHIGWGKSQRPVMNIEYRTQLLYNDVQSVVENVPTLNRHGTYSYFERDRCNRLTGSEMVVAAGASALYTYDKVNEEQVITFTKHTTDQSFYYLPDIKTPSVPFDKKYKKCGY